MLGVDPSKSFTMRDMLMPSALLERTNWRDNPILSGPARSGLFRFALARFMEISLLGLGSLLPVFAFFVSRNIDVAIHAGHPSAYPIPLELMKIIVFVPHYSNLLYLVFIFLLLRYHLLAGDVSGYMKKLARDPASELILSRLGSDELFLHKLLVMCRSHWALAAFAAIWAGFLIWDAFTAGQAWRLPLVYYWLGLGLNTILMVWVAGLFQYIVEWNWFAGRPSSPVQTIKSLVISLGISLVVWIVSLGIAIRLTSTIACKYAFGYIAQKGEVMSPLPICVICLVSVFACTGGFLILTWKRGQQVHSVAGERIREQVQRSTD